MVGTWTDSVLEGSIIRLLSICQVGEISKKYDYMQAWKTRSGGARFAWCKYAYAFCLSPKNGSCRDLERLIFLPNCHLSLTPFDHSS
jgi:hypothetical protein